jgi:hypothetical protein
LKALLTLIFTVVLFNLFAQDYIVRGFVYDKDNGEPVEFTKVFLQSKDRPTEDAIGATTNLDGFFNFAKVKAGNYQIIVKNIEYSDIVRDITVGKEAILNIKFELEKPDDIRQIEEVEIRADDKSKTTKVEISVNKLDQKGLERLPGIGGENDIVAAFSVTPGVVTTGDQGGQIYVRGGTPIQNKILLDGMTIYNPFHSIGFFSVFETELVRSADIYTGGYGAQYGGRIASIMDITYRDGNMKKHGGKVSVSPFLAKAVLEGPLAKKENRKASEGGSYIVSAKHSLLDYVSPTVYPYTNDGQGLPFSFTDLYGKITLKADGGSKFNAFGFYNDDAVKYPTVADLNWKQYGGGLNFVLVPSSSPMLIKGHVNASNYQINFLEQESDQQPRSSSIGGFDLGFDFSYFLKDQSEITTGFNIGGFNTDFLTFNEANRVIQVANFNAELSLYTNMRFVKNRWVFQPGMRIQYYMSMPDMQLEPRLAAKYNATENLRFKFSGGRYSQNFTSASSDRDVMQLFYGFLGAPTNVQSNFTQPNGDIINPGNGIQIAWHTIGGLEYDLTKSWTVNFELYYKHFPKLTNINLFKLYEDVAEFNQIDDVYKKDFLIESGYAYGADLLIKYSKKRLFFWGVYSYGYSERWDGFMWYFPIFDRRHNINLVGNYLFGKKKDFEVSIRWNLGSGLPFTPTAGYYQGESFNQGVITDYTTSNTNNLSILLGGMNSARVPAYHRLDFTAKKRWEMKNKSVLEAVFGITNMYNRDNIFYVNRVTNEKIYQLPIIPSLGASYKF